MYPFCARSGHSLQPGSGKLVTPPYLPGLKIATIFVAVGLRVCQGVVAAPQGNLGYNTSERMEAGQIYVRTITE